MKKLILAGFSLLAVGLLVLGSQANVVGYKTVQPSRTVQVCMIESKADGNQEKKTYSLSSEQYALFFQELNNARDPETRLKVFQKYGLVSMEVTFEKLQSSFMEKAQNLGFTTKKIKSIRNFLGGYFQILGILCAVDCQCASLWPSRITLRGLLPRNREKSMPVINLDQHVTFAYLNINLEKEQYYQVVDFIGFVGFTVVLFNPIWPPWYYESTGFALMVLNP